MKSFAVLILSVLVGAGLIMTGGWKGKAKSVATTRAVPVSTVNAASKQTSGVVDGAVNPELIPDRVAYSLVFRLIANRQIAEEKSRIRAYIRQMGLSDADTDGLIAAAEEFQQRVGELDAQAKQIKASNRGNSSAQLTAHLVQLQHQKEAIVDHIVVRLPLRLSGDGLGKLRQHVIERVKRHVKFRPN